MAGLLFSLLLMQPIIKSALWPHSHGWLRGRSWPAEADAHGALSLLHLLLAGRREAAKTAQPARDALLVEEGIPGRPHPAASLSPPLVAGPAPPFPTGAAARGAGAAATCALPLTGTRALLPAWSAFRRRISVRGPRAAGRPGRVTPASPTWRRGPGGLLRGREKKAARACGALHCGSPTTATGEAELRPAL